MEIVLRSTAIFFFLWALTRAMGKRELSEMTAFELMLLVTMGDLIQQGATQEDMSVTGAFLAVGTIAFWSLAWSYLGFRFSRARRVIEGLPVIVIRDGEPIQEAMRLERVTMADLVTVARNQGIGDLADVRIAVLEPDGRFSFIKRTEDDAPRQPEQHEL